MTSTFPGLERLAAQLAEQQAVADAEKFVAAVKKALADTKLHPTVIELMLCHCGVLEKVSFELAKMHYGEFLRKAEVDAIANLRKQLDAAEGAAK